MVYLISVHFHPGKPPYSQLFPSWWPFNCSPERLQHIRSEMNTHLTQLNTNADILIAAVTAVWTTWSFAYQTASWVLTSAGIYWIFTNLIPKIQLKNKSEVVKISTWLISQYLTVYVLFEWRTIWILYLASTRFVGHGYFYLISRVG